MNQFLNEVIDQRLERTANALTKNNFEVHIVCDRAQARECVKALLNDGDSIGVGGSETLSECDILSLVREDRYSFIDRYESGLSKSEIAKRHVQSLGANVYITSSNAITENGELYNVDGNGNRVAAIAFGPKSVIVIAGYNKIVKDLNEAVKRVKSCAAPANTKRLSMPSYCAQAGECMSLAAGQCGMTDGCHSEGRICCDYLVSGFQRRAGRIKVILVKESLGF